MPDSQGVLTPEERVKVSEWLKVHWKQPLICPVSGHNEWALADHVVQPLINSGAGIMLGGSSYPQVMVVCRGCGYTVYFNAIMIGIFPAGVPHGAS
jgi:hypothetical protein